MPGTFSESHTGPANCATRPRDAAAKGSDGASTTSNISTASGSVVGILPGAQSGDGGSWHKASEQRGGYNALKEKKRKEKKKAARRKMLELQRLGKELFAMLNLPPMTTTDLKKWLAAHRVIDEKAVKVRELTDTIEKAIRSQIGIEACRVAGSTHRQTSDISKVDIDLAIYSGQLSLKPQDVLQLLGPESKNVIWQRSDPSVHKNDDGRESRRIFAQIVHKVAPSVSIDIAVFSDKHDFDRQGEVLHSLRNRQQYFPASRPLTVAMKGCLRAYASFFREAHGIHASAPGIAIELAAAHAAKRYPDIKEVTPELLQAGLHAFATPTAALKADWGHDAYSFNAKSPSFDELRFGAKVMSEAIASATSAEADDESE